MTYQIERTDTEILIRLPLASTPKQVQNALNYLRYVELGNEGAITPEEVQEMVAETKGRWWEENKERFRGVEGFEHYFN